MTLNKRPNGIRKEFQKIKWEGLIDLRIISYILL